MSDADRDAAYNELQPLVRRYVRRQKAFEAAESNYLEKLYLWSLTVAMLEARGNPGNFAGDIPEHDMFAYHEYLEAAENLLPGLRVYLRRYADPDDTNTTELNHLQAEASQTINLPAPASSSRLQDAVTAMRSNSYKQMAHDTNERLAQIGVEGVKVMGSSFGGSLQEWLQKYISFHTQTQTLPMPQTPPQ